MSTLTLVLLILLIVLLVGGLPPISGHAYGWGPSSVVGVLIIILIIMLLTGRL